MAVVFAAVAVTEVSKKCGVVDQHMPNVILLEAEAGL